MMDDTKQRIHAETIKAIELIAIETGTPLDLSQTQTGAEIVAIRARMVMLEKEIAAAHKAIVGLLEVQSAALQNAKDHHVALAEAMGQIQALKTVCGFDEDMIDEDGNPKSSH
jgi:hypothetical protein